MKSFQRSTALSLLLITGSVQAHSHLEASTPAEGSILASAPATLVLTFSAATRLTALSLQKAGEAKQVITPLPTTVEATHKVAVPTLAPGAYTVHWRVVGSDSHVMSGQLHFTVNPSLATDPKTKR